MKKNCYVAKNIEEALKRKSKSPNKTKFLAGGTNIFRLGASEFNNLIDLQELGLNKIEGTAKGVKIGATATFSQVLESDLVPSYLKEALMMCKSKTLRNMATIGGNINSGIDTSYLVSTLSAAKVRIVVAELNSENKVNKENLPIREYLENEARFKSCLILNIILPVNPRYVVTKTFRRSSQAPSVVTVSYGINKDGSSPRFGVSTSSCKFQRLEDVEKAIESNTYKSKDNLYKIASKAVKVKEDHLGSKNYKKHLVATTVCEILEEKGDL